ncbi:Hypothetical protein (plasmid) [Pseudomonas putida]|nr:Hypothetical protein [Pseudomonas putida]
MGSMAAPKGEYPSIDLLALPISDHVPQDFSGRVGGSAG